MVRQVFVIGFFIASFCLGAPVHWDPTAVRGRTSSWMASGQYESGIQDLVAGLKDRAGASMRMRGEELEQWVVVADCVRLMQLKGAMADKTRDWILASDDRLHALVETVSVHDDINRCFALLDRLAAHDPQGRDAWFNLMLALSVVWDRPVRPAVHYQMGTNTLPYKSDVLLRYDYFKSLYESVDAKIPFEVLSVGALTFVVETPVPLSELVWAREHESGERQLWGNTYRSINYDHARVNRSQYQWPYGAYSLASIKERGGICVDQAYYAVLTARSFGIPAIYFSGNGKDAGHAWFSFMKEPGQWDLGVGRYEGQDFTTGQTINPQTQKTMTDHEVAYLYTSSASDQALDQAEAYALFGEVLIDDSDCAVRCAHRARQWVPELKRAWDLELAVRLNEENFREVIKLFDEQQRVLKEYPDIVMETAARLDPVLRAAGMEDEADRLRRTLSRKMDDDRDDLTRFLERDEISECLASGNSKGARRKMERLLEDRLAEGSKLFPLIRYYLKITHESDQAKESARFLEDYVEAMIKTAEFSVGYERILLEYLVLACETAGDTKRLEKAQDRLRSLEF